jgi:hypothetical protein
MTIDWTTGVRSTAEAKDFSYSLCVETSSDSHPAPYLVGTGGPFPGGKARAGRDADHSPHLVPRSRMSRSYTSSLLWRPHGLAGQLYIHLRISVYIILSYSTTALLRVLSSSIILSLNAV